MFPFKNRKIVGYKFGTPTFYNTFHIGTDYASEGDEVLAPFDGIAVESVGPQGGNTLTFSPTGQDVVIRFLHLQQFKKTGEVKEGEVIGIVGHTGLVSPPGISGAHCHIDVSKHALDLNNNSNFIDPELFNWKGIIMSNVMLYKRGNEYGFVLPTTKEDALIDKALNFGYPLPTTDNGTKVDWANVKPEIILPS